MKKFRYTKTALASLLTLYSFNSFAIDREIKKLDSSLEVAKTKEIMKTSNKKLREKISKVCNNVPKKKEDKNFVRNVEDAASTVSSKVSKVGKDISDKTSDVVQATKDKATNAAQATKDKAINAAQATKDKASNIVKSEKNKANGASKGAESQKGSSPIDSTKQDQSKKDSLKLKQFTNKNINDKIKDGNDRIKDENGKIGESIRKDSGLKLTFGSVVEAQGYYKVGSRDDIYKEYNEMDKFATGNYSMDGGTFADAVLHLRAEDKNEDLSIAYGADVQLHVPVSKSKSDTYGIQAIRNRGVHAFLNTEYGDLKVGYQFGPEASMRLDATRIATADGGADSNWFKKVNLKGKMHDFPFYVTPRLYTESFSSGSAEFAFTEMGKKDHVNTLPFRIAYYSPSYMGFRFGLSYSPRYEESLFEMEKPNKMKSKYSETVNFNDENSKASQVRDTLAQHFVTKVLANAHDDFNIDKIFKMDAVANKLNAVTNNNGTSKTLDNDDSTLIALYTEFADKIYEALPKTLVVQPAQSDISNLTNSYGLVAYEEQDLQSMLSQIVQDTISQIQPNKEQVKDSIVQSIKENIHVDSNTKKVIIKKDEFGKDVKDAGDAALKKYLEEVYKNNKNVQDSIQKVLTQALVRQSLTTSLPPVHSGPSYEHIVSGGVSYEYYFDEYKLRVKASAVGEYGKPGKPDSEKHIYNQYTEYHDLLGANIGAIADYKIDEDQSIRVAGSFAYLGKSGQPKNDLVLNNGKYEDVERFKEKFKAYDNNTMYWTLGAAYQYENITTSLTYFGSNKNDGDKLHDFSLGAQYNLSSKGSKTEFIPYAALHHFRTDEDTTHKTEGNNTESNNKNEDVYNGTFVVVGVKFIF